MTEKMPAYIAFQGGGALGMAHLGAWQKVSQKFTIIGTSGTSAGSIVAAFCAAGYTPPHAIDIFKQLNWSEYVNRQRIWNLVLKRDAYSNGKRFHKWLQEKLGAVERQGQDINFADLYKSKNIYLAIVACDLNSQRGEPVVFDKDKEPSTTVSFAVRASISIPGLFKPVSRLDRREELVDGGVLLNFPVELLHSRSQEANCALIGVRFKQSIKYLESPRVGEAIKGTLGLMTRRGEIPPDDIANDSNYIDIEIDVSDFDFLKFDLTNTEKEKLVRCGADAAKLALARYEARIRPQVPTPNYIDSPVELGNNNSPVQSPSRPISLSSNEIKPNPFGHTGQIENPDDFFGREELLRQLFEELRRGSSCSLVGEDQVGKSSILWMVCKLGPERLQLKKEAFIYLNMQNVYDEKDFFEALCGALEIESCRGYKLERELRGKRYILCLDEIDNMVREERFTGQERTELRGLAGGPKKPFTLLTASQKPLKDLFPDSPLRTSPLAGICQQIDVKPFSLDEARRFLKHRLTGTNVSFSESEISQLLEQSGGNPGRLQQAAADLYRHLTQLSG
jgi:predicted acylesterase/phospholipase RssA